MALFAGWLEKVIQALFVLVTFNSVTPGPGAVVVVGKIGLQCFLPFRLHPRSSELK